MSEGSTAATTGTFTASDAALTASVGTVARSEAAARVASFFTNLGDSRVDAAADYLGI